MMILVPCSKLAWFF